MPQMLANTRRFIEATPYKDIEVIDDDMRDEFLAMMEAGLLVIAEEDGKHMGGVGAVASPLFINRSLVTASERFWWVAPEHRASGLGKVLFKAIYEAAKKSGCSHLVMFSLCDPYVDALYEKAGMTKTDHTFMVKL